METSPKSALKFSFASTQFWLCNISGWVAFDIAQGFRDSFNGSPVVDNFINYIPTSILGMVVGLCVHFFYKKFQWHKHHPMQLIPIAGLIAVVFACINISINLFDLVISIPEICSRQNPRSPNYCGEVSDLFLQSLEVMSIWCLFYFLTQAERKTQSDVRFSIWDASKAIVTVLTLIHLGTLLSVIAYAEWGNNHYLFSKPYFISAIREFIFTGIFSLYIFFIKPGEPLFGSRILPLIPTLCVVSFFCTVLTIGAMGASDRLYYLYTNNSGPLYDYWYHIIFGSNYGNFNNTGALAGMLEGSFANNLLVSLFFLSYQYSSHWKINPASIMFDRDIKKSIQFWSYNFLFWIFFSLLIYATDLMSLNEIGKSVPLTSTISFVAIGIFMGSILRSQIRYFAATKTASTILGLKVFISSIFMGALLTSALWLINYVYIFVVLDGHELKAYTSFVESRTYVYASILVSCILCGLWSFICYMIEAQHIQRNATIKQLQIEMNMKEIQLNALAGKIDPHFIFNALNNIRALVDEDSEKARSAIVVLSDILRSPIKNNLQDKILVAEEMLLVRNYIALSKIQLEDYLTYQEDVSEEASTALIPSMMLQILVENAIKHGISQLPDGGALSLHVYKCEQQLVCKIINHGSLRLNSNTSGFGVGIKVIHERLALLYNNDASFSLKEENNTVIAELIFPFENSV